MESSDHIEKSALHDWIENETRPLDVVASWESLCDTYRVLEFTDPINDTVRLEEYKWIIKEINKHLTRAKRQLLTCTDPEAAIELLMNMFTPSGNMNISTRREIAYHKLRQRWITQMIAQLRMTMEEQDGSREYRTD